MSKKLTPDQRDKANELMESAQDDLEGVIFNLVAELASTAKELAEIKERFDVSEKEMSRRTSGYLEHVHDLGIERDELKRQVERLLSQQKGQ
jgi:hypothetical protein